MTPSPSPQTIASPISDRVQRWLAQRIITHTGEYVLSVLTVWHDTSGLWQWRVEPFEREIAGTSFFNGCIRVTERSSGSEPLLEFVPF